MSKITESVRADGAAKAAGHSTPPGVAAALSQRIGPQRYNAWFKHGTRVVVEEQSVRVLVPNLFVANWIESHYQSDIAAAVEGETGCFLPVSVTLDPALSGELRKGQRDSQAQMVDHTAQGLTRPRRPDPAPVLRHRLDSFVVGRSNRLAYSAAMLASSSEAAPFNPLFIHGPCGVGKTHLLQGVCNRITKRRNGQPVWRYVTAEGFTNEFITALKARKLDEFRARYRKLDLLAIDDVHFLANKKATQEEFLHTFNAIESAGRQVILASDAHPRMVGELNEQLISRFMAGMVVKVETPDRATRFEILTRRCRAMKLRISDEVLSYVAEHVRGSVRELEGALYKLTAVASLQSEQLGLDTVAEALADHMARTDSVVTLGDIESTVATWFGITPADIHSSRRTRTISAARMLTMYLARRHTRMSYPEIGRYMGKNHSSVVLGVQRMEKLLNRGGQLEWSTPAGKRQMPAKAVVDALAEQVC